MKSLRLYVTLCMFVLWGSNVTHAGDWDVCPNVNSGETAIEACTRIIDKKRDTKKNLSIAYQNRGAAKYKMGNIAGAIEDYDASLKLNPKYSAAWAARGAAEFYRGNLSVALQDYDKAISLSGRNADAYYSRGTVHQKMGALDLALKDYSKAIALKPKMTNAFFNRGTVYEAQGNWLAALNNYEQVVKLDPNDIEARKKLEAVRMKLQ